MFSVSSAPHVEFGVVNIHPGGRAHVGRDKLRIRTQYRHVESQAADRGEFRPVADAIVQQFDAPLAVVTTDGVDPRTVPPAFRRVAGIEGIGRVEKVRGQRSGRRPHGVQGNHPGLDRPTGKVLCGGVGGAARGTVSRRRRHAGIRISRRVGTRRPGGGRHGPRIAGLIRIGPTRIALRVAGHGKSRLAGGVSRPSGALPGRGVPTGKVLAG